jgi:hypothetical protein
VRRLPTIEAHHDHICAACSTARCSGSEAIRPAHRGPGWLRVCRRTCRILSSAGSGEASSKRPAEMLGVDCCEPRFHNHEDGTGASIDIIDSRAASYARSLGAAAAGPGNHCSGAGSGDGTLHCSGGWGQQCDSVPLHDFLPAPMHYNKKRSITTSMLQNARSRYNSERKRGRQPPAGRHTLNPAPSPPAGLAGAACTALGGCRGW